MTPMHSASLDWPFGTWDGTRDWLLGAPVRIVLVLLGALVLRWAVHRAIRGVVDAAVSRADEHERSSVDRLLHTGTGVADERRRQRALTMGSLLRSVATFVIVAILRFEIGR